MQMKYGTASGRIEECPACTDLLDVDERGRIPSHLRATGWRRAEVDGTWTWETTARAPDACKGAGRASKQEEARRAAAKAETLTARACAARDEAAVALDAFLEDRTDANARELLDRMPEFRILALHAYARRFKIRKKIRAPWLWVKQGNTRLSPTPRSRGDVYCLFCGELLMRAVTRTSIGNEFASPSNHTTRCMLWFLAGIRDAVQPGTRTLPEEHRQEAAS
jgi:hypothetical protein